MAGARVTVASVAAARVVGWEEAVGEVKVMVRETVERVAAARAVARAAAARVETRAAVGGSRALPPASGVAEVMARSDSREGVVRGRRLPWRWLPPRAARRSSPRHQLLR